MDQRYTVDQLLPRLNLYHAEMQKLWKELQAEFVKSNGEPTDKTAELEGKIDLLVDKSGLRRPDERIILSRGLFQASFRTPSGKFIRRLGLPGRNAKLYVRPLGEFSASSIEWTLSEMTIVDQCHTGVYNIDDSFVYVPFTKLQQLTKMAKTKDYPARCSQIHVRVDPKLTDPKELRQISAEIQVVCNKFCKKNKNVTRNGSLKAQTFRQLQAQLIDSISGQRTLSVTIFGIMSIVSVFLIFVIFYMIVLQKTKDIGILKSIGGSGMGIAGIFLGYGVIVGLVGSAVGIVGGYFFVDNINSIHDWVGRVSGISFWSMESFMFAEIPNQVDWNATIYIVIGAIFAGLLGALIPAIIAATRQPIKALRYE